MNSYNQVYEEWFDSEDNVIVISNSETGQLVIGFCEDIISIGYIINMNGNYDIGIDSQFQPNWNIFTDNNLSKYIKNTQEALYQTMFNLLYCLNKRNIKYKFDINNINKDVDRFYGMCSMNKFIDGLRKIIKENIEIKEGTY